MLKWFPNMKTTFPEAKTLEGQRAWRHLDARDKVLGRLATQAAMMLMGKNKVLWTPHLDCGDFVVVTNAQNVKLTGKKLTQKEYFSHSGYPDGKKMTSVKKLLAERPERVIELAVRRMLPKTRLGRKMFTRLKVYSGDTHPHGSQRPK
ncbi:MAG: 50S ribosomal protein L13 [Elusimicrobia bacterium]|nr:50S ribosomal protein L13 [Elusimicrobiota bacterium]